MDASACGTLPALSARCTLKNLRERFAALRGSGHPLRLLVDVRPEGDQRHHLEGAIASEVERSTEHHLRFVDLCVVASEDADHRSIVRAWMVGEPASQDAVAAACKSAGAWLHPRLVSARLVSGSMPAGAVAWSSALAAISGGASRLVAKPHSLGDVDFVVPEAGVPASGPLSELFSRLAGAEFTPDRLFVIEDVVEASIVLLDRLDDGLPKKSDDGSDGCDVSGQGGGKRKRGTGRPPGRPRIPDKEKRPPRAEQVAAWWRQWAVDNNVGDWIEPEVVSLAEIRDELDRKKPVAHIGSLKGEVPSWWPKTADGEHELRLKWTDCGKTWKKPETFPKLCRRFEAWETGPARTQRFNQGDTDPRGASGRYGTHPRDAVLAALDKAILQASRLEELEGSEKGRKIAEDQHYELLVAFKRHQQFLRLIVDASPKDIVDALLKGDAKKVGENLAGMVQKVQETQPEKKAGE
jgi:hypothetical protein